MIIIFFDQIYQIYYFSYQKLSYALGVLKISLYHLYGFVDLYIIRAYFFVATIVVYHNSVEILWCSRGFLLTLLRLVRLPAVHRIGVYGSAVGFTRQTCRAIRSYPPTFVDTRFFYFILMTQKYIYKGQVAKIFLL